MKMGYQALAVLGIAALIVVLLVNEESPGPSKPDAPVSENGAVTQPRPPPPADAPAPIATAPFEAPQVPVETAAPVTPGGLRALVLDAKRRPLPDIGVTVRQWDDRRECWYRQTRALSGADGLATLGKVRDRSGGQNPLQLTFEAAFLDPPIVAIDAEALPEQPVELVLPPVGTLSVVVRDGAGEPWAQSLRISMTPLATPDGEEPLGPTRGRRSPDPEGAPPRWMVGLGLSFAVRVVAEDAASGFEPVEVVGAGPDREGEERQMVVVFGLERLPVLAGRFVRRDGTPVEAGFVSAVDRIQPDDDGKRLPWQKVTVQDGGKFRLVVHGECPVNGSYRCELEELNADGGRKKEPERAWIDLSRGYPPCDTDIGDVTLDRSILCSGRVVDQDGEPLPEASVQAYRISPSGSTRAIGKEQPVSGPDGSFTLYWDKRAAPPPTGLAVKATDAMAMPQVPRVPQHGAPPDHTEFETGATGVELRVFVGGLIVGSIDAEGVVIGVTRGGGWFDLMRPADRGPFRIPAMPGQVSVVVLANRGAGPELVRVDDVAVRKGEVTEDPRLQDLQVAADLHCLKLRIADEKDQPVIQACAFHQDGTFIGWSDSGGRITVAGQSPGWDLEVVAHGFRPTQLSGVREDRDVVLRRGPMVQLEVADRAGIAELGHVILISLTPAEEDPARTRFIRREPLPISSEVMTRVASGGAWRVKWWFRHPGKRGGSATSAVPEEAPQVIEIADSTTMQSFMLQPPLHLIRQEIEKLSNRH